MPVGGQEISVSFSDFRITDLIISDVRYISLDLERVQLRASAMHFLMIAGLKPEVEDLAVRRLSTMLQETNETVLQENFKEKTIFRSNLPVRIGTDRKLSGYGTMIINQ
jgi:hypothetical protein